MTNDKLTATARVNSSSYRFPNSAKTVQSDGDGVCDGYRLTARLMPVTEKAISGWQPILSATLCRQCAHSLNPCAILRSHRLPFAENGYTSAGHWKYDDNACTDKVSQYVADDGNVASNDQYFIASAVWCFGPGPQHTQSLKGAQCYY